MDRIIRFVYVVKTVCNVTVYICLCVLSVSIFVIFIYIFLIKKASFPYFIFLERKIFFWYKYFLQIHIEPILLGDTGEQKVHVPCNFFDMPGTAETEKINKDDLEKIVNGELKLNEKVSYEISLKTLI